ncbi:glycosyl hydrolase family 28 protein [Rhodopirellula sp. P2]|uniref:glycosyl hydrolase family 28 protein n=1 Tax=Rhodopirellula sp. P2 TaxID=2127060 RepID=UPI002368507F|nr:glycosyl hydrolase family 28 protein [Rhodopirellula sp. P2]WDQ17116.1 glycosyl hydrolase family 28 protein [Rhodopirellula sp. P2]
MITLLLLIVCCEGGPVEAASPTTPGQADSVSRRIVTPNEFEGTDIERINEAIEVAAANGGRAVIPKFNWVDGKRQDIWRIDSAILLQNDTTLELENCHIKLSDRCRDNFMRSANCGLGMTDIQPMQNIHVRGVGQVVLEGADRPRATGDSGKTLGKHTFGTDAGVAGESQSGDWRNIGILLAFVDHFSIENISIQDSHCWAISLERCAHGTLRDLDFASTGHKTIDNTRKTILNQDGIDLRMGCHDILIDNITGSTGDDLIALTAIPRPEILAGSVASTMVSAGKDRGQGLDAIRHIIVRNVKGYSRGGHHIVRLLNTSGVKMHDILVDGLIDTSPDGLRCKAAVKIGDHSYGGGVAPLGDTQRIIVNNVTSQSKHTILVGGSLADSILTNLIRFGSPGDAVTIQAGADSIRDVTITNVHVLDN